MRSKMPLPLLLGVLAGLAATALVAAETEMEGKIRSALVEKLGSDAQTIRVAFYDGKALLSGKVAELPTQELAKEVALWVPGVAKVENEIEAANERSIGKGKMLAESEDAALESAVKSALHDEVGTHSSSIEVEVCMGVVSLRGTLPDKARHDLALAAAKKVAEVRKVVDLLRVAG